MRIILEVLWHIRLVNMNVAQWPHISHNSIRMLPEKHQPGWYHHTDWDRSTWMIPNISHKNEHRCRSDISKIGKCECYRTYFIKINMDVASTYLTRTGQHVCSQTYLREVTIHTSGKHRSLNNQQQFGHMSVMVKSPAARLFSTYAG